MEPSPKSLQSAKILQNTVFILLSRAIQLGVSFFIVIAVARYLTVEEYGEYSYIIALVSSVMALSYFGIQQVLIREVASKRVTARDAFCAAVRLRGALTLVALAALGAAALLSNPSPFLIQMGVLAVISELYLAYSMLNRAVFQANEVMVYEPLITIVTFGSLALGTYAVIQADMRIAGLLVAIAVSNLIQFLFTGGILVKKFFKPSFKCDSEILRRFFKDSLVIGVGVFFYQNLFRINVLGLRWFGTSAEVSQFQVPHSLVLQVLFIPAAIAASVFPVLSRLHDNDHEAFEDLFGKTFRFMAVAFVFGALGLSTLADTAVPVMFGEKYRAAVSVLRLLAWAMVPLSLDIFLNIVLVVMGKQKYSMYYTGAALALSLPAGALLIPRYGHMAAAWIALSSYVAVTACSFYFVRRSGIRVRLIGFGVKILCGTFVSYMVFLFTRGHGAIVAPVLSWVTFILMLALTRAVRLHDLGVLRGIIRGRRSRIK